MVEKQGLKKGGCLHNAATHVLCIYVDMHTPTLCTEASVKKQ